MPRSIPSHDTFGRVFAALNPEEFESSFTEWVQAINQLTQGQVIAIDEKQLRGSQDSGAGKNAIYMVSAWATENQLVLGQHKVIEVQDRCFISSLESNAEKILRSKRSYWGIENRLHWVLDIAFIDTVFIFHAYN